MLQNRTVLFVTNIELREGCIVTLLVYTFFPMGNAASREKGLLADERQPGMPGVSAPILTYRYH